MPKCDALMCILFSQIMVYIVDMVLHTHSNSILVCISKRNQQFPLVAWIVLLLQFSALEI